MPHARISKMRLTTGAVSGLTCSGALFIRSENIAVWRVGHSVFAFLSILNADGAQLLTRSCRPPFIEYVGDRHHVHRGGILILRVDVVRKRHKPYAERGKDVIEILPDQ